MLHQRPAVRGKLRLFRAGLAACALPAPSVLSSLSRRTRLAMKKLSISADEVEELKKGFVAISSLVSLVLVFAGPMLFPALFAKFCTVFFALLLAVNSSHLVKFTRSNYMLWKTISQSIRLPSAIPFAHVHAIIVPNYCEPLPLLRDTVSRFASHPHARSNYVMVLAMEAAEGDEALSKARTLAAEFKSRFLSVIVSVHPKGLAGESAGKGANVAWAANQASSILTSRNAANKVILTVTDADGSIAPLYFSEIEREMVSPSKPDLVFNPEFRLFAPPIFFARNCQSVPAPVRATDSAWSVGMIQNLSCSRGLNIPCSTYSVTLPLALHVGGWDVNRDAIGEDMHMFLKCFYHTKGAARSTPIWAPVNLANVQDPNGYVSSLAARFTQARRHFAGSPDSLYAIRHTFFSKPQSMPAALDGPWNNMFDRVLCLLDTLEAHVVPATAWLSILAMPALKFFSPAVAASSSALASMAPLLIVPYIGCCVQYELLHRFLEFSGVLGNATPPKSLDRVTLKAVLTSCRTRRLRNMLDYVTLPLCVILYVAAPATSHCSTALRILMRAKRVDFKYVVAAKTVVGLDLHTEKSRVLDEIVSKPPSPAAQCTFASPVDLHVWRPSVPAPLTSDEAICADTLPLSTIASLPASFWLSPRRGHIKHDSGIFALEESKVSSLQVVA